MRVFLTGGTGLVGSHVARLLSERGDGVVCLQRPSSDVAYLEGLGCHIVGGDVRDDPDDLASLMDGCQAVVHAAALVYPSSSWSRIREVNVVGTRRVLDAARRAGVARAVHVSSVAVHAPGARGANLYARSKLQAEEVALEAGEAGSLEVCALRPPGIYGERDRLLSPRLAAVVRWPLTPLLGPGDVPLPLVYAGNVAEAVLRGIEAPGAPGRALDLGDDHPVTQRSLHQDLGRGLGVTVRTVQVPGSLVRLGAHLLDALRSKGGGRRGSARRYARLILDGNPYESREARDVLGWRPSVPSSEALKRTGRWLRRSHDPSAPGDGARAAPPEQRSP